VCTVTEAKDDVNSVILAKGKPIPSVQVGRFVLAEPGQTGALIELLQGDDGAPKDQCKVLGHFELKGLTPIHDRPHPIDVRFSIDRNGVLTAEAYDAISDKRAEMVVDENLILRAGGSADQPQQRRAG
jgi:molecular chaperone DnaK (HSP70)